jgi:hypothetical protein
VSPQARTGLIAFGVVGGLFLVGGGTVAGIIALQGKKSDAAPNVRLTTPVETKEGIEWGVEELAGYLRSRLSPQPDLVYPHNKRLNMTFSPHLRFDKTITEDRLIEMGYDKLVGAVSMSSEPMMTPASMKDRATQRNATRPGSAFAWGRFCFTGDPVYVAKIKATLQ